MVIIPILGEALLDLKDILGAGAGEAVGETVGAVPLAVGFFASLIVGCIACKWMLNIVKKGKLIWLLSTVSLPPLICLAKGYNLL